MATIQHQIGIRASKEVVYRAIATAQGISGWWTKTTGSPDVQGESVYFHFGEKTLTMSVHTQKENTQVIWKCIDCNPEWDVTHIRFDLSEGKNGQIIVDFYHDQWQEATGFMRHCSMKWGVFLLSLKQYIETGTGRPFPNDISIYHGE